MNILKLNKFNFNYFTRKAANVLRSGGIVIAPFDTVYGIICDAKNTESVRKIFDFKERPLEKTIGLAVSSVRSLSEIAEISDENREFIKERTPGRYTFILKAKDSGISDYCIKNGTIGVRIPDSKLILEIIDKSNLILAQTSANKSGKGDCFSVDDLMKQYTPEQLEKIDLIIDGGIIKSDKPSTIIDLTDSKPKVIER